MYAHVLPLEMARSILTPNYIYHLWNPGTGFVMLTGHIHVLIRNFYFDKSVWGDIEGTYKYMGSSMVYLIINNGFTMYYFNFDGNLQATTMLIRSQGNWDQWSSGLSNIIIIDTSKRKVAEVLGLYPLHPTFHTNKEFIPDTSWK